MLFFKNKYYNNQALQFWKARNDRFMLDITTDFLLLKTENISMCINLNGYR